MRRAIKVPLFVFWVIVSGITTVPSAFADEINYFYDDIGRLSRLVKGNSAALYQYDEVGNLISITSGTTAANPPFIQSFFPDVLFIGQTTSIIITGQNFLTISQIATDNPSLLIRTDSITDTEIQADIVSDSTLSAGSVNLTITNLYGSATIQFTLTSSKLIFKPNPMALVPGSNGTVMVGIAPLIGKDITIPIFSSDSSIVSVPSTIQISSNGTATFVVNAIQEGVAEISSGDINSIVFVTQPFSPLPDEVISNSAGPISVIIDQPSDIASTLSSGPFSVIIDQPSQLTSTSTSRPVSAYIIGTSSDPGPGDSLSGYASPLSVLIDQPSLVPTSTAAGAVSAFIALPSAVSSSIETGAVSAYIDSSVGQSTIMSRIVSVKISQ